MNVYNYLISGNAKYGSNKEHICKSSFNCRTSDIQENVIVAPTWGVDLFSEHVDNIRCICECTDHKFSVSELTLGAEKVTYIKTGACASNVLDCVLALGCTLCKNVLFIGAVGALDKNMKIGDIVIPKYSVCGVGADRYLTDESITENDSYGKKYYSNEEFSAKALKISSEMIKNNGLKCHAGKTFSVDTIFAQYAHLEEFINIGCNTIEMETATFFHTANVVGIKATAVLSIVDNTLSGKGIYKGKTDKDKKIIQEMKKILMPKIALKILLK